MSHQYANLKTIVVASFTLLTVVSAAALPHPSPNSLSSPTLKYSNSSTLKIPVDERFSISQGATGRPLDPTACKMVAFQLLTELALLDWESSLPGMHSPMTAYPSVFMYGGAPLSMSETRSKYLIWGLCLVMYESIRRGWFVEVEYDLIFDGQTVGVFHILGVGVGDGGIGASSSSAADKVALLEESEGGRAGRSSFDSTALNVTNQPVSIQPVLIPEAQSLDPDQVWLALYVTLEALAFPDKNTILVVPFTLTPAHTNIKIMITSHHGSDTPGLWPPLLLYSVIIEAFKQLPTWLLSPRGDFKETLFGIFVGENLLGFGCCQWAWRPDASTTGSRLNASVS